MLLRSMRVTRGSTVGEEYRVLRLESITKVKSVSREGLDNIISTTVQMKMDLRTSSQALLTGINALGLLAGNVLAGWVRDAAGGALAPVFAVAAGVAAFVGVVVLIGFWPKP